MFSLENLRQITHNLREETDRLAVEHKNDSKDHRVLAQLAIIRALSWEIDRNADTIMTLKA